MGNKYFDAAARDSFKISRFNDIDKDAHIIDEQIDSIVDRLDEDCPEYYSMSKNDIASLTDLSEFKPKKELNPKIWINGRINSKVRNRLLEIADDFIETLETNWAKPKDIILTGSLANYNWTKFSDFDLHIIVDYNEVDERTEFVADYFNSKKNEWNTSHDNLKIYGFPVELYVQDSNEYHNASGIYSLERDKWLVEPEPNNIKAIKLDKFLIKSKAVKYMKAICSLEDELNSSRSDEEISETGRKANMLFRKIKGLRKEGLKKSGEMNPMNIMYKVLRNNGFISRLIDIKAKTYDKMKSID